MGTLGERYNAAWHSPQADGGGYPPDGEHDVTVQRVVLSEINSKGEMIAPTFVFFLADEVGCGFKTYQSIKSEKALWRMKGIIKRLGLAMPESPDGILDSLRALEGRIVRVRVTSRDYNGRTMHDVDFLAVVAASGAAYTAQTATAPTQGATASQSAPSAPMDSPQYPPQQQQWQPAPWPAQPMPSPQAQLDAVFPPAQPQPAQPQPPQYAPAPTAPAQPVAPVAAPQYAPQWPTQPPQCAPQPQWPTQPPQVVTQATQPAPPGEAMVGEPYTGEVPF